MHAKLTLRLEEELIELAKSYSRETGKSLSRIVADYFRMLTARPGGDVEALPPTVQSLKGSLRGAEVDEDDYRRYLEEKHL